jgi:hypothetical protein
MKVPCQSSQLAISQEEEAAVMVLMGAIVVVAPCGPCSMLVIVDPASF